LIQTEMTGGAPPPPFKSLGMKGPEIVVVRRADGVVLVESRHDAGSNPRSLAHLLQIQARAFPDRPFIRQRTEGDGPWRTLTYGQALDQAERFAAWLIARGVSAGEPVLILSGNSIEHAVVSLGAMTAGAPAAPLSPAFSLLATDHATLRHCASAVRPRVVFAQSGVVFERAIETLRAGDPDLVFVTADGAAGTTALAETLSEPVTEAVARRRDTVEPETLAKILFTSGSTGLPKGVPQTQGMMTAVIAGLDGLQSAARDPEVAGETLEWMPWSHLAAGNVNFNSVLAEAGTVYLDDGKPAPGLFDKTIRNLREVSPIHFSSAPIAYGMLAEALEADPVLRSSFFRNLRYMAYGGATLSNDLYERLQALAIRETGFRIPMITMYGSTETQGITMTHWATDRAGLIGLPLPGIRLKLVPNGLKMEVRVAGPTVTAGYLGDPERSAAAFDEEGYYRLGDAVRFIDEADPARGLVFDGRVAEDFKLSSGTWVSVGVLRPDLIAACSPLLQDAVIAGQDQDYAAALIWPSAAGRSFATSDEAFEAEIRTRLTAHNAAAGGTSRRIERFAVMSEPLSLAAGEITDKGYVNQRAVLDQRAQKVVDLYGNPPPVGVVVV
jgi:feruloyl-CoA synthase